MYAMRSHAVKISFANEVGTLCKALGVDAEEVTKIYTSDTKLNISPAYLSPGFAFWRIVPAEGFTGSGSSCERTRSGTASASSRCCPATRCNIDRAVDAVLRTNKKKVAFLGLSFKPGTDDLRESPQVQMIKRLLEKGSQLRVWTATYL